MLRKLVIAIATKALLATTNVLLFAIKDSSNITRALFVIAKLFNRILFIFLLTIETILFFTKVESLDITKVTFVIGTKLILVIIKIITIDKLSSLRINIDLYLINNLIYYVKNDKTRLCISRNTKSIVIRATHNDYFYANYYRIHVKLNNTIYIYKLSRKLIIYIRHCF